ncbi:MAG: arginine--tRNA ligase [Pirellulales bacterium]
MKLLATIRQRFVDALTGWVENPAEHAARVAPARDPRFGDYQANIAMPLEKQLGMKPQEIAKQLVSRLKIEDLCLPPEIAGPGFINLRLRSEWLADGVASAVRNDRLGITHVDAPRTYVIDYSAPNVAKPMHVGHIRSTVIGDSLARILRFLGHRVISDNHLGDWGTQFGMVIYGYKHFRDDAAFERDPVPELSRLYRVVQQIISYQELKASHATRAEKVQAAKRRVSALEEKVAGGDKKAEKELKSAIKAADELQKDFNSDQEKIAAVDADAKLAGFAAAHPDLDERAQLETAKMHAGDEENLALWNRFLPLCIEEIEKVYRRLNVTFDYQYGESFYHPMLGPLVDQLTKNGTAVESEGALCVFLPGFDAPMIVRKKDGAFLYATTDIATIEYRMKEFHPDAILYVVDHRQGEHFAKLFAAARVLGYEAVELQHVAFGTVTGKDGKPFKTRSGSVVGLDYLLDEAVDRAYQVVCNPERLQKADLVMSEEEKRGVSETIGLGAIKYADLCHNRAGDYVFDVDQMVQLEGNTAAYIQYSYARARSIFRRAEVEPTDDWVASTKLQLVEPAERDLALALLQFEESLSGSLDGYYPSVLAGYLYGLAKQFAIFFDRCHVIKAESEELRASRLLLCHAAASTIKLGLDLLGIDIVERM